MSRNTASVIGPSRRAPRGGRTAQPPPRCGLPSHGRNVVASWQATASLDRRAAGCLPVAATTSAAAESGALGERDLFRGSLRNDGDQSVQDGVGLLAKHGVAAAGQAHHCGLGQTLADADASLGRGHLVRLPDHH